MAETHRQRRARVSRIAKEWLDQDPLILDTETTGYGRDDEIISVAILDKEGTLLYESLVRPTMPIPPEATAIHGITNRDVRNAPDGASVLQQLTPILSGRLVCMYNADFDTRMLWQTASACNVAAPGFRPACVMKLFAEYAGTRDPRFDDWRWWKLPDAISAIGLPAFDGHHSLPDTQATLALLQHMASAPVNGRAMQPPESAPKEHKAREIPATIRVAPSKPKRRGCLGLVGAGVVFSVVAVASVK